MAQFNYIPEDIILEIPDLVLDDTIIKRKATLSTLIYNIPYKTLTLAWIVKHYSKDGEGYGNYIGDKVPDKVRETIADNTTWVKVETGEIILDLDQYKETILVDGETIPEHQIPKIHSVNYPTINELGETIDNWIEEQEIDENGNLLFDTISAYTPKVEQSIISINYMGQYDWFNMMARTQPMIIHQMIRIYGAQVDWSIKLK